MTTSVLAVVDALSEVLAGCDINFGRVLTSQPFWRTSGDVARDAVVMLDVPSEIDPELVAAEGKVAMRFWIIDHTTSFSALTTNTYEARHEIRVSGFYGWREGMNDERRLRRAADLAIGALVEAENAVLRPLVGAPFIGYLTELPRVDGDIDTARVADTDAQGFSLRVHLTYFEEIAVP